MYTFASSEMRKIFIVYPVSKVAKKKRKCRTPKTGREISIIMLEMLRRNK